MYILCEYELLFDGGWYIDGSCSNVIIFSCLISYASLDGENTRERLLGFRLNFRWDAFLFSSHAHLFVCEHIVVPLL